MTDKRDRIITDPGLGPKDPHRPSTLRSLNAEAAGELNPNAPVYYEPTPLVATSNHKTLEVQTVKLSDDIDPRKLQTELRLDRVPSFVPPSDSFWPPETALASSQPPPSNTRRWRAPAVLIAVSCALLLLVVGRAVARRSAALAARQSGILQTVSGAGLAPVTASLPSAPPAVTEPAPVAVTEPSAEPSAELAAEPAPEPAPIAPTEGAAAVPTPAPLANAASSASAPSSASTPSSASALPSASADSSSSTAAPVTFIPSGIATHGSHASTATQRALTPTAPPGAPLATPSASKPKRAIY